MYRYGLILIIFSIVLISHCKKTDYRIEQQMNIFNYSWGTNDQIIIEDNKYHSFKYLDTISHQLVGDSLVDIDVLESGQIIIRKLIPTSMEMVEKEGITEFEITKAHFFPDTFSIAVKNYIDTQFLILFSNSSASRVYKLKSKDSNIPEINSDCQPQYKISGYSVGEKIDREKIEILDSDIFGSRVTEEACLIDNKNIIFTIIGYNYIEKIEIGNIRDSELDRLIRSVDKSFSEKYEYEELINGEGEFKEIVKGYYWNEMDVSIYLQKIEKPSEIQEDNYWTLEYSNHIITNILQNYLRSSTESV